MKKLLNTLYVTTSETYLSREGEAVKIKKDKTLVGRVPLHNLDGIVCYGPVGCSPNLMGFCGKNNIALTFMNRYGKFLVRIAGPVSGNVLLRRGQYRWSDDQEKSTQIANSFLLGKLSNCKNILLRVLRDRPDYKANPEIKLAAKKISSIAEQMPKAIDLEQLRGLEGEAARAYFGCFDHLITMQKEDFFFHGRNRRPPLDNVNAVLSFLYSILVHDVVSALETVGLDPAVGFLHRDRPGRPSLALDLMEEFRPILADRVVLSMINRKQITGKGFHKTETGAVVMDDDTRKIVLQTFQNRKQEELKHPFLGEKIKIGLLAHAQAMLLARHIRGDLDGYPPFVWK